MEREEERHGNSENGDGQSGESQDGLDSPANSNRFDPRKLRLSQDFGEMTGVKKEIISIAVRKPAKTWWCRVRPGEDFRLQTLLLELQEENETYLLDPKLWPILAAESVVRPFLLILSVTRQDVLFLWKTRLPGPDGKSNQWWDTGLEAIGEPKRIGSGFLPTWRRVAMMCSARSRNSRSLPGRKLVLKRF